MDWLKKILAAFVSLFSRKTVEVPKSIETPKEEKMETEKPEPVTQSEAYKLLCQYLVEEAKKWIGTTEHGGDNKGPEVEQFQKAVDGKAQGESWCLAFVQFCVQQAEKRLKAEKGLEVNHWLYPTEHVMTLWNNMPVAARLKEPPHAGCLILWQHWKDGKPTSSGHVGVITEVLNLTSVKTVEGNTSPNLTGDQREGDGVYEKQRSLVGGNTLKVKGFLMVWDSESAIHA